MHVGRGRGHLRQRARDGAKERACRRAARQRTTRMGDVGSSGRSARLRNALEEAERSAQGDGSRNRVCTGGGLENDMNRYLLLFSAIKIVVVLLFVVNSAA